VVLGFGPLTVHVDSDELDFLFEPALGVPGKVGWDGPESGEENGGEEETEPRGLGEEDDGEERGEEEDGGEGDGFERGEVGGKGDGLGGKVWGEGVVSGSMAASCVVL
jgi:hypothetical protein